MEMRNQLHAFAAVALPIAEETTKVIIKYHLRLINFLSIVRNFLNLIFNWSFDGNIH